MKWTDIYLSLGSNLGNRQRQIVSAAKLVASLPTIRKAQLSRLYRSDPVNALPPHFLNAALYAQTTLSIPQLFETMHTIERILGKKPKAKETPRLIDIDILFYGVERYRSSDLQIPHWAWQDRLFVLKPLSDLTGTIHVPTDQGKVQTVNLQNCIDEKDKQICEVYPSKISVSEKMKS